jgi:hypothetical protein
MIVEKEVKVRIVQMMDEKLWLSAWMMSGTTSDPSTPTLQYSLCQRRTYPPLVGLLQQT